MQPAANVPTAGTYVYTLWPVRPVKQVKLAKDTGLLLLLLPVG